MRFVCLLAAIALRLLSPGPLLFPPAVAFGGALGVSLGPQRFCLGVLLLGDGRLYFAGRFGHSPCRHRSDDEDRRQGDDCFFTRLSAQAGVSFYVKVSDQNAGASGGLREPWVGRLKGKKLLTLYDRDEAGDAATAWRTAHFPGAMAVAIPAPKPGLKVKDVTDYWRAGGEGRGVGSRANL